MQNPLPLWLYFIFAKSVHFHSIYVEFTTDELLNSGGPTYLSFYSYFYYYKFEIQASKIFFRTLVFSFIKMLVGFGRELVKYCKFIFSYLT